MCNCGVDSIFPQSVLDTVLQTQTSAQVATTNTTTITPETGLTVVKSTTTDAAGNITQAFTISNQGVGTWRTVTAGTAGSSVSVNNRTPLRSRIEHYTKPTTSGGSNTAGTKAVIRLDGTYGYTTPVINTFEHIATVNAEAYPATRKIFPIVCYGIDLGLEVVDYASGIAYIDTNGEVHAMFTSTVPTVGVDAYAIEIDFTYVTEA